MAHVLFLVAILLSHAYAGPVARLGSPAWAERDAATRELRDDLPASAFAVLSAQVGTDSPEVKQRCDAILGRYGAFAEAMAADAAVWALVTSDEECDGLPLLSWERYQHMAEDARYREPMIRVVEAMRRRGHFTTGETFYCEHTPGPDTFRGPEHWMAGIQVLRLAYRGIRVADWRKLSDADLRALWAKKKAERK